MRALLLALLVGVAHAANPPPALTVPPGYNLQLSWGAVSTYTTGVKLPTTPWYKLYAMDNPAMPGFIGYLGQGVLSTHRLMTAPGTHCFAITAQVYDPTLNEGAKSTPICVAVQVNAPKVPSSTSPVCAK